jgi:putative membrane protein
MKIFSAIVAVAVAAISIPVLAQTGQGSNAFDQKFVTMAMTSNNTEIDQARAALAGRPNASVRLFATTMIKDHTAANSTLGAIAHSLNLTYPDSHVQTGSTTEAGTPPPASGSGAMMSTTSARSYMQLQVKEHTEAIALFQNEARNGGSGQLRTFAADTLPTLKAHLAMANQYLASGTITPAPTPTPAM